MTKDRIAPLEPYDEHNQKLESNVHPRDWKNPVPNGKYNLVVIGAGTAGLVAASGAAGMGAKVALIERELLGGDCLNVGCVPSKAIIASAHVMASAHDAKRFGVSIPEGTTVDFPAVMERMRKLRADISPHDSAQRFTDLGIDVFIGSARFSDPETIEVEGARLEFAKAVIATGGRASAPPIEGLDTVEYLTNETIFSLTELPARLGVVGAGPIGCEMAQTFARFGSKVSMFTGQSGILPKEAPDAGSLIGKQLLHDGVQIFDYGSTLAISRNDDGSITLRNEADESAEAIVVDKLLIAVGRAPNVKGLGLEAACVDYDEKSGVHVNDKLQTTNKRVYAAGDVCSKFQFTHAADFMARNVIRNALFGGRAKVSDLVIPWTTYTSPEVAHVGPTWRELDKLSHEIDEFSLDMSKVDRAILEGETDGFVRIFVRKGSDKIVAATIVAKNAGDMISQVSQAMTAGVGLGKIASTISPYPTQGEAIRKVGDLYNRTKLTPTVAKLFKKWLEWSRR
ncbi:MAG: mercuric reductase [Verrucomicrobiales bacterium]|nr:mercuric reductase [Verrucomicrobiales bacterium]